MNKLYIKSVDEDLYVTYPKNTVDEGKPLYKLLTAMEKIEPYADVLSTILPELVREFWTNHHLTFKALADCDFSFSNTLEYSLDMGDTWQTLESGTTVSVAKGNTISWRGNLVPDENHGIGNFTSTERFDAYGNIMSLSYGDNLENTTLYSHHFYKLFNHYAHIKSAKYLILPSMELADYCYCGMFHDTSLVDAPKLPSTTLANKCYQAMFANCSLTIAPELPATTLYESCYGGMFSGCGQLTTAPELPATTLAEYCYQDMFKDCTSLTTVHNLPATTLADSCYRDMFNGCTRLANGPKFTATTLADYCCANMFSGCIELGGISELHAKTLVEGCYSGMCENCRQISLITMTATDITATNCLRNFTSGVSREGTFYKDGSTNGDDIIRAIGNESLSDWRFTDYTNS